MIGPARFLCCLLLATTSASFVHAQDRTPPLRRWAVLTPKDVHAKGLDDLLLAELSKEKNLELLDRADLDRLTAELSLAQLVGPRDHESRLQLGKKLRADALLIITEQAETKQKPATRTLVVCETRHGARLRIQHVPPDQDPKKLAQTIGQLIQDLRRQYAGGIRHVVGITPLVNRSLTHEHDSLQTGLAQLLQAEFARQPGVAVLEIEEAQRLRKELETAPGDELSRIVPLFLDGQFQVTRKPGEEATLKLTLRWTDGGKLKGNVEPPDMPLTEIAGYLKSKAAPEILDKAGIEAAPPLTVQQQFASLVEQAQAFARIGIRPEAIALREAALLLNPSAADQRKLLMREYYLEMVEKGPENIFDKKNPQPLMQHSVHKIACWYASLGHLDYLVRTRRVKLHEATIFFQRMTTALPDHFGNWCSFVPDLQPILKRLDEDKNRYLVESFPLILKLEPEYPGRKYYLQEVATWQGELFRAATIAFHRSWQTPPRPHTLDDLKFFRHLLEKVIPDEPVVYWQMSSMIYSWSHLRPEDWKKALFTEKEYVAFLEETARSSKPLVAIHGKWGLLVRRTHGNEKNAAVINELIADLTALEKEVAQHLLPAYHGYFDTGIPAIRNRLKGELASLQPPTKLPSEPIKKDPEVPNRLRFEQLKFEVKRLDGKKEDLWNYGNWGSKVFNARGLQVLPCRAGLDVFWCGGGIMLQRTKGVLEEALMDPEADFCDVVFDGRHIWVGSRGNGLTVLSESGSVLHKIARDQGLPPTDGNVRLFPLAPGKVFVAGSFKPRRRAWCALVELGKSGPQVEVIHEATRIHTPSDDLKEIIADPHMAFFPSWIRPHPAPGPNPRYLVLNRWEAGDTLIMGFLRHPLLIDLEEKKASLFQANAVGQHNGFMENFVQLDSGECLTPDTNQVTLHAAPGKKLEGGKDRKILIDLPRHQFNFYRLLPHDGFVYAPGRVWYRIHPKTFQVERLSPDDLPYPHGSYRHFAVSAHHGLLAWDSQNDLHRVTVLEGKKP